MNTTNYSIISQETCLDSNFSGNISTLLFFEIDNTEYLSVGDWNGFITIYSVNLYNHLQVSYTKKSKIITKIPEDPIFCQVSFYGNLFIGTGLGLLYMIDIASCLRGSDVIQYLGKHELGLIGIKTIEPDKLIITAGWDGMINVYSVSQYPNLQLEIDTERKIICFGKPYAIISIKT